MKELIVPADVKQLENVLEFIDGQLEGIECPPRILNNIHIAAEEIFVNISNYAYKPEDGDAIIRCIVEDTPRAIIIQFVDNGKAFDPLAKDDPDVTLPIEEREIGGLGVYMVKKSMDSMEYQYSNGRNILTIRKNF